MKIKMKRNELDNIIYVSYLRAIIDNHHRLCYKLPEKRKEIEKSNKKTYTKKQVLEILDYIKYQDTWYLYWNKIEDEPTTEQKTN